MLPEHLLILFAAVSLADARVSVCVCVSVSVSVCLRVCAHVCVCVCVCGHRCSLAHGVRQRVRGRGGQAAVCWGGEPPGLGAVYCFSPACLHA